MNEKPLQSEQKENKKHELHKPLISDNRKKEARTEQKHLIAAIRRGDGEAFGHFYLHYADKLIGVLTKLLGNEEDAREIVQDTFVMLWETRDTLDVHSSLDGFVYGVARNLALKMIRSKNKRLELDHDLFLAREEFGDLTDDGIISKETSIIINMVFKSMPVQRRRVFEMSRNEGLSYNEIADKLGITYNTVRWHIEAAKKEIASAIMSVLFLIFL